MGVGVQEGWWVRGMVGGERWGEAKGGSWRTGSVEVEGQRACR